MRERDYQEIKTASILGSFNRHYDTICRTAAYFEQHGIEILAPRISKIKENNGGELRKPDFRFPVSKNNIPIEKDNYFIKKAEVELNKILKRY